jgi:hypothetical protein
MRDPLELSGEVMLSSQPVESDTNDAATGPSDDPQRAVPAVAAACVTVTAEVPVHAPVVSTAAPAIATAIRRAINEYILWRRCSVG